MQVTPEELATLLGMKTIEIFAMQKQIAAMQKRIEELTPKAEAQP